MQLQRTNTLPVFMSYNNYNQLGNIQIEPQKRTPFVKFKRDQGLLLIKGTSIEKNAMDFYGPLVTIVDSYLSEEEKLTCYFYFKEFNLATAKSLFQLFKTLGEYHLLEKKITINWFADWHNNEMIQTGIDFSELYGLKMHILPI